MIIKILLIIIVIMILLYLTIKYFKKNNKIKGGCILQDYLDSINEYYYNKYFNEKSQCHLAASLSAIHLMGEYGWINVKEALYYSFIYPLYNEKFHIINSTAIPDSSEIIKHILINYYIQNNENINEEKKIKKINDFEVINENGNTYTFTYLLPNSYKNIDIKEKKNFYYFLNKQESKYIFNYNTNIYRDESQKINKTNYELQETDIIKFNYITINEGLKEYSFDENNLITFLKEYDKDYEECKNYKDLKETYLKKKEDIFETFYKKYEKATNKYKPRINEFIYQYAITLSYAMNCQLECNDLNIPIYGSYNYPFNYFGLLIDLNKYKINFTSFLNEKIIEYIPLIIIPYSGGHYYTIGIDKDNNSICYNDAGEYYNLSNLIHMIFYKIPESKFINFNFSKKYIKKIVDDILLLEQPKQPKQDLTTPTTESKLLTSTTSTLPIKPTIESSTLPIKQEQPIILSTSLNTFSSSSNSHSRSRSRSRKRKSIKRKSRSRSRKRKSIKRKSRSRSIKRKSIKRKSIKRKSRSRSSKRKSRSRSRKH